MRIRELIKKYDGKTVVDSVSFQIPRGKVTSFIGPNGAGKSTVMGMISRLLQRDSGLIEFEGKDIKGWRSRELSRRLAILTQSNQIQMKLTVEELVAFGRFPYSRGRLTDEDKRIIDRAISYMELEAFRERFIDELSGGQRQRAYIAMVIAQDTEYILLDEPTNNLDIYHATNLMKMVRRLCDELGKTVVLVLHEINYAAFYSDYICAFADGKVEKFGKVEEVITKETLSKLYRVEFEIMEIEENLFQSKKRKQEKLKMKKTGLLILAAVMVLGLSACSGSNETNQSQTEAVTKAEPSVVTVKTLNGDKKEVDLEVPFDPKRVAVMDMAALDILEQLGLEERVVGASDTSLDYLEKYMEKEQVAALGTIKEADMEAVMASEPDVIFIGGRLAKSYDALSEIAPVVYLSIDTQLGTLESVRKNAGIIASIFGLEEQADQLLEGFEERLAALAGFSTDKTAIVGMVTSGGFNVLGNDGRCSLISREAGFENIGVDAEIDTSTHGNEASFEFVVEKEPDYVFVLDRDAAVGTEGAKLAQEIMENELIMGTEAYRNGNLIYLSNPAVWYTAEGGIRALDQMIGDLEYALLK